MAPSRASRTLQGAAKLRGAASSVAPVASGYERSQRPSDAGFSLLQRTRSVEGGQS